jgi:hypothetical protein
MYILNTDLPNWNMEHESGTEYSSQIDEPGWIVDARFCWIQQLILTKTMIFEFFWSVE